MVDNMFFGRTKLKFLKSNYLTDNNENYGFRFKKELKNIKDEKKEKQIKFLKFKK